MGCRCLADNPPLGLVVFQFYGKVGTEKTKSQGEFLCTWQMRWSLRLWQVRLNRKQTEMRMRQRQLYIKNFGDLVNPAAPIHVKQDSLVHNVLAKFVKMDGETEDYLCSGDSIMYDGVKLKQSFVGTGYSDEVRHFPDYASRLYFMTEE